MQQGRNKGHVEFKQPLAQVVANRPEDDKLRKQIDELKANDGYEQSCGIVDNRIDG
ncbi:hypothetical protein [Paenibacillus xerothermodurans]|uniref:hypothetical protein n=1 Tax=Paenibacillus xerothermodurans TaxID=1977292 RepID=UPI001402ECA0|nr:hypothetical protein [Paenibacillus xerothermodurans]